jgi:hypothetical protein
MKKRLLIAASALTVLALCLNIATPAMIVSAQSADQNGGGQALEIAPPVLNLSGNPGETINSEISLRDVSTSSLVVTGEVNDFTANGEDGSPKILLEEGETSPYSMKDWFAPLAQLTLKSREIRKLPISISIPADAAPGGYYSVVRFTATPPELEDQGVSLSASLGALVLMRVNGQAKEGITIETFETAKDGKTNNLFEGGPINFVTRLKNTGTIHEQPAGTVTVTDMFGKTIGAVSVNQPVRNILPQSTRKFESPLDKSVIGNKILFGRYTATLKVTYGESNQTVTKQVSFWVIPYRAIGIAIIAMLITFFALRFMIRRYNQHIIKQAQKSSKSRRK